jgi:hypothetical protein
MDKEEIGLRLQVEVSKIRADWSMRQLMKQLGTTAEDKQEMTSSLRARYEAGTVDPAAFCEQMAFIFSLEVTE